MIVVSDTSPITNLAAIAQLSLLQSLYGSIIIPKAVFRALTEIAVAVPGTQEVQTLAWIQIRPVTDSLYKIILPLHQPIALLLEQSRLNSTIAHPLQYKIILPLRQLIAPQLSDRQPSPT